MAERRPQLCRRGRSRPGPALPLCAFVSWAFWQTFHREPTEVRAGNAVGHAVVPKRTQAGFPDPRVSCEETRRGTRSALSGPGEDAADQPGPERTHTVPLRLTASGSDCSCFRDRDFP